ncbi:MAG: 2-C-methyl-D-erythritol 4-phosphate cytidylyltransferase [Chitinispirillaceae bacterium]|nr:2-C-methyl-D-erythritol 4-phosphate cytidylyltransferase [Chitinispirillaceae bacterium]
MSDGSLSAIIVAAGAGSRLNATMPKAFMPLGEKPLFRYSLETFLCHPGIRDVILVVPRELVAQTQSIIAGLAPGKSVLAVAGGKERWQSVQNGATATDADWALVHDAARPFVTHAVIDAVLAKRNVFDCVITVTPEVDTIRTMSGRLAGDIVDRSKLVRVQTPQLFRRPVLMETFAAATQLASPPTDEAVLMQQCGVPVAIAWGDPANFKITTPADLKIAEAVVAHRR